MFASRTTTVTTRSPVDGPSGRGAARVVDVTKVYGSGETTVRALDAISLDFAAGELTAIMGPSGSGKSTLLHLLAGLDRPTSGTVMLGEQDLGVLNERRLTLLRRERLGFVFQAYNLIPTLTAAENITLPLRLAGREPDAEWFARVVAVVGLANRLAHRPSQLSGGQQQRVALARAIVSRPEVVYADEPTGALDSHAAGEVLGFLRAAVDDFGQTVVMVTHDPIAASFADRVVLLADGRPVTELRDPTAATVLDQLKTLGG